MQKMLNEIHTWGSELPSQSKPQEQQQVSRSQASFWNPQDV